jgi:hypothetical protein
MQPRIYTYKITFEEIPNWYWGAHKEKKYGEPYLGSPTTHAWRWGFYTPYMEILELFPYTDEGWDDACRVEKRCIKPDLNNPLCLNENAGGYMSLEALRGGAKKTNEIIHAVRDDLGRSVNAVKAVTAAHKEKDDLGRSVLGVRNAERLNEDKDDFGRSVAAIRGATAAHEEKDDLGRSVNAVKCGIITSSQKWLCLETGHVSTPGGLAAYQRARGIDPKRKVRLP